MNSPRSNFRLLEISCQYTFNHFNKKSSITNLDKEIRWILDANQYIRKVFVSGNEILKLEYRVLYIELDRQSSKYDRLISGIIERFTTKIDSI